MIKTLPLNQRHTGCKRCNQIGCCWMREKHPTLGHWLWYGLRTYREVKEYFFPRNPPIKVKESEILEEISMCPYCGDEETRDSCCGEVHFEPGVRLERDHFLLSEIIILKGK